MATTSFDVTGGSLDSWLGFLDDLGGVVEQHLKPPVGGNVALNQRTEEVLGRLRAIDRGLASEIDNLIAEAICEGERVGIRIGYALARTLPTDLREFLDWPQRASRLTGLPLDED